MKSSDTFSGAGPSRRQAAVKRAFDVAVAAIGLTATAPLLLIAYVVAGIDTRGNGLFTQVRVGRHAEHFRLLKIRTMRSDTNAGSLVTTRHDPRVTASGRILRRLKIDELPQLINVLLGDMSLVGPRPDVPGFADRLEGADRIILSVRPGITGPASLKYRDEEILLARQEDPERYNAEVMYPDKIRLNRAYVENYRFISDVRYLIETLVPSWRSSCDYDESEHA